MNFSVVIPLYNKSLYIERAIQSILRQTCQDFEIIVVNDGSTDNGREIAANIRDPRIRLIDQPNQGVSAARNRGINAATNPLIAFLDADDEWRPDFLREIQRLLNNFPDCGAYATATETIRPNGTTFLTDLGQLPPEPWLGILPNVFEMFQYGLSVLNSSSTVVPKQVLIDVDGFPEGIVLMEDIACWVKIAIGYPIAYNPKRLVIYHQEASNRSNVHKNLNQAPFIPIIQAAIRNSLLSDELQESALEFLAQQQIFTAMTNVMVGNPAYARQLLETCRTTKKYKKMWLWWHFWALFPPGWPARFLKVKQIFQTKQDYQPRRELTRRSET